MTRTHRGRYDAMGRPIYETPDEERFDRRVTKLDTGCWEWQGGKNNKGYCDSAYVFGERYAHRASWVKHFGPIPDGLFVLHRCDNPPCVNPDHLFLGTNADNVADMVAKGRQQRMRNERASAAKLTNAQVEDIRRRVAAGESQASLAKQYGVHSSTINRTVHGQLHPPDLDPVTFLPAARCPCRTPA